jgi:hypothetical protein
MTQVVGVRTTVQKQPRRVVGHSDLVALIPAISMLAPGAYVSAHARLPR